MSHPNSSSNHAPASRALLTSVILSLTIACTSYLYGVSAKTVQATPPANTTTNASQTTKAAVPTAKTTAPPKPALADSPTVTTTPTPTEVIQVQALTKEVEQLVTISTETRDLLKQRENTPRWWDNLDEALDSSLTATLAGLALAAAAFLLSLESKTTNDALSKRDFSSLDQLNLAIKYLVWSFYSFIVALVDTLTFDPATDLGEEWTWKSFTDLIASGGGTAVGIVLMTIGGYKLHQLVSPKRPSMTDGLGEIAGQATPKQVSPATAPAKPSGVQRISKFLGGIFRRTSRPT